MSINWVMLSQHGDIVRLPHEHIRHTKGPRISIELSNVKLTHGLSPAPFSLKCNDGKVYITTQRVIFIPTKPTADFKSFAVPILNVEDSRIESGWIGAWYWRAFAKPVPQGGIPADVVRVEIKLYFNEGGHNEFRQRFEEIKERLHHIRDIERETGQRISVPDEPLPAYEAQAQAGGSGSGSGSGSGRGLGGGGDGGGSAAHAGASGAAAGGSGAGPAVGQGSLAPPTGAALPGRSDSSSSARRAPDEPPPAYDEAQAQTLSMRLEDHIRDEADLDDSADRGRD